VLHRIVHVFCPVAPKEGKCAQTVLKGEEPFENENVTGARWVRYPTIRGLPTLKASATLVRIKAGMVLTRLGDTQKPGKFLHAHKVVWEQRENPLKDDFALNG